MFKTLLLPTDGTDLSNKSIDKAVIFAAEINAKIIGITVTEPFHYISIDSISISDTPETYASEMAKTANERLAHIAKRCSELEVSCETVHCEASHPYSAIVATAEEHNCDLIFMASHGRSGLSALLVGSEVSKVLTHTNIPVLVYR
ncbi:MAG: universal stress protein [Burkholderiales bacterium]|jgi:nucleotide-binding universal stress UspA family protein|nr:universal stress protein [Burkholderiales bacterium]